MTPTHEAGGIVYADATGEPWAAEQAARTASAKMEGALKRLGFRFLGHTWSKMTGGTPFVGLDGKEWEEVFAAGSTSVVWVSEDGTATAEPEYAFGSHWLHFRSALDDGFVVETRRALDRLPKTVDPFADAESPEERQALRHLAGNLVEAIRDCDYPLAGYSVKTLAVEPEELWAQHCGRVEAQCRVRRAAPLAGVDIRLHLDVCVRALRIKMRAMEVAHRTYWPSIGLVALPLALAMIVQLGWWSVLPLILLCLVGGMLALVGEIAWPTRWGLSLARRLPLVRRRPFR